MVAGVNQVCVCACRFMCVRCLKLSKQEEYMFLGWGGGGGGKCILEAILSKANLS